MSTVRAGRTYSAEHEWVLTEGPGVASVGISAVAAEALGDIVYVDLPAIGSVIVAGAVCGEVESTKSVAELFAPVGGVVVEVNSAVTGDPSLLNSDPYGEGWLFRVKVSAEGPLLSAEDYAVSQGADVE